MCTKPTKELLPELSYAESLMRHRPDSALIVLDSMEVPSPSDKLQYATWCLLATQARDKNYVKHTSDSLIRIALDYFGKQGDPVWKATALYYAGRVNHDLHHAEEATEYYLQAKEVALHTTDYKLLYLIHSQLGTLYAYRDLKELARDAYQQAYDYAALLKDSALISYACSYLGRVASLEKDWNKGLEYYKKAVEAAEPPECWRALNLAYGGMSIMYQRLSMLDSSMYYLKKSERIEEVYIAATLPQTYLGLGKIYFYLEQPDSARFYLEKALNTTNLYTKQNAFQILYYLYKDLGEHEKAIKYNEQYWLYRDSVDVANNNRAVIEIQEKYEREKLQNINNQLQITKWKHEFVAVCIILFLLLIIFIVMVIYHQKLKDKIEEIESIRKELKSHIDLVQDNKKKIKNNLEQIKILSKQLEEKQNLHLDLLQKKRQISQLSEQNKFLQEQNVQSLKKMEQYEKTLLEGDKKLEAYGKVVVENMILHDREKYLCTQLIKQISILNKLVSDPVCLKEYQWKAIFDATELIYPHWVEHLRKKFVLQDGDVLVCCLIKLGFPNSLIAELLNITPTSVTKRKQRLKVRINEHLETSLNGETTIEAYLEKL